MSKQGEHMEKRLYECWHYLDTAAEVEIWYAVILQISICSAVSRLCHLNPVYIVPDPACVCFCLSHLCKRWSRKWDARMVNRLIRLWLVALHVCVSFAINLTIVSWSTTLDWECSWAARYHDSNCTYNVPSDEQSRESHFCCCKLVDQQDCKLPTLWAYHVIWIRDLYASAGWELSHDWW